MKKKIFSILLIAVLVLSSFATVFADDDTTTPKTVSMTFTGGKAGHTYTAYQIFKGDAAGGSTFPNTSTTASSPTPADGTIANIQWGADAPNDFKADYATAAAAAEDVSTKNARDFAQSLNLSGDGSAKVTLTADGDVEFKNLEPGYYVIVDTNGNTDAVEGDYTSAFMVALADDVTGKLKGSAATSEKKVGDVNDSEKTLKIDTTGLANVDYKDSADFDIDDAVPFKLKATTADNVAAYKKYHITFQDKQEAGLTPPTEYKVSVLGKTFVVPATGDNPAAQTTDNGTKITVTRETPDTGKTFAIKVEFEPTGEGAKYLNAECNSTDIVVLYTSVLNKNAVIGATGNKNEMCIKYSNNPEDEDGGDEGETPDDTVIVFTYKTVVDKVDEEGNDLAGADFTLYKEVQSDYEGAKLGSEIKATFNDKVKAAAGALNDEKYYVVAGQKSGDATGSTFSFNGIDDGTYVLVETTIPTGYNAWASKEVTITAKHADDDDTVNTPLTLYELKATAPFTENNLAAGSVTRKDGERTHSRESGEAYAEIENNSGAVLPETGGMGTTIIYILGAALVIGAGVVLVSRKRSNDR